MRSVAMPAWRLFRMLRVVRLTALSLIGAFATYSSAQAQAPISISSFASGQSSARDWNGKQQNYNSQAQFYIVKNRVFVNDGSGNKGGVGNLGKRICYDSLTDNVGELRKCLTVTRKGSTIGVSYDSTRIIEGCLTTDRGDLGRLEFRESGSFTVRLYQAEYGLKCDVDNYQGSSSFNGYYYGRGYNRNFQGDHYSPSSTQCFARNDIPKENDLNKGLRSLAEAINKKSKDTSVCN